GIVSRIAPPRLAHLDGVVTAAAPVAATPVLSGDFAAGMVTDAGGVNDQSFNQSAWHGLQRLSATIGAAVDYLESPTPELLPVNMATLVGRDKDIIWAIGFMSADAVVEQALENPQQMFGIIDFYFGDAILPNVVAVDFLDNEATFVAGYLAARHSNTGVIGFLGGMPIPVIHRFESGFRAGVLYANVTYGLEVVALVDYINDFINADIAREISSQMHAAGADVLFAAAGGAGQGAIDAAIAYDIYVIGVDRNQADLAPNHMIVSTLKHVGEAIYDVSMRLSRGEEVGGQNLVYGLARNAVGITPYIGSTAVLVDMDVHSSAMQISGRIARGELQVPENLDELMQFENSLQ
ncbi:MAG: BMP family ABC transporter substrate-binding protein, partial [Defluviitaleaceae bacterium]|nr:BMP family ABC transporter substrate-binding protein [Defluviitaleaceae bacterium]